MNNKTKASTSLHLNIVAIVGSLRVGSANRVVLNAAIELAPAGVTVTEYPLADVPLYNGDVEDAGDPEAVVGLKAAVAAADGLLIVTPEYNRSIPGVTKNAIDWASRTPGDSAIGGKPVGSISASPGGHDCGGVRAALDLALAGALAVPFGESVGLGRVFDMIQDGRLSDETARETIARYVADFAQFVRDQQVSEK